MKFLFIALLFIAYNHARLTIPIEKVKIEPPVSEPTSDAAIVHRLGKSSDSMKVTLWNQRNARVLGDFRDFLFIYFGNVYVGSNNQTMRVQFDTGSNDLWVSTPDCIGCPGTSRFSCANSTTCSRNPTTKSLTYGRGSVNGYTGSDMIGLTPTFRTKTPILLAINGKDFENLSPAEGILGLGSRDGMEDFIDLAFKEGLIEEKIFAFHLDYNPDGSSKNLTNRTFMTIGYVPEDKINNMAWIPLAFGGRWSTNLLGAKVGNTSLSKLATLGPVLFDTGCSAIHLNQDIQNEFLSQMKKFSYKIYYGINWWPCLKEDLVKYPNISLSVAGLRIDITAKSYFDFPSRFTFSNVTYCQMLIAEPLFGFNILGDAFLQENFVAYSRRNQTIGINLDGKHQILPNPNPPLFVIWIQLGLMMVIGVILFIIQKKRRGTKTALSDQDTLGAKASFQQNL